MGLRGTGSRAGLCFRPSVGDMARLDFIACKGPCTAAYESNKPLGSLPRVAGEGADPAASASGGAETERGQGPQSFLSRKGTAFVGIEHLIKSWKSRQVTKGRDKK